MRRIDRWFRRDSADLVALIVVILWGVGAPFRKAALAEIAGCVDLCLGEGPDRPKYGEPWRSDQPGGGTGLRGLDSDEQAALGALLCDIE
jgi:hypothetical protein